jgi:hypothetical protein
MNVLEAIKFMESLTVQSYNFNDLADIEIDQSNKGYIKIIAKDAKGNIVDIKLWCNAEVTVKNIFKSKE